MLANNLTGVREIVDETMVTFPIFLRLRINWDLNLLSLLKKE